MSLLQDTTLLPTGHGQNGTANGAASLRPSGLRSKVSIAALIDLVRDPTGTVKEAVSEWQTGLTKEQREERQRVDTKKQVLYLQMRSAVAYDVWEAAALELDELEGNNAWKHTVESDEYDPSMIQNRLDQLDEARTNCDTRRMFFLIRTALTRNLGNMGNLKLYKQSHIGTKILIERYIDSVKKTLDAIVEASAREKKVPEAAQQLHQEIVNTRQAFGRSALLLSGGATFGMSHSGVLKALWEQGLLPRIISGASAGSIVCSVLCCRTDEEIPELLATFCHGDLAVFEEDGKADTLITKAIRFMKFGALFDISHLTRVMKDLLGDMTFAEAYRRTRRILNICVSSSSLYELPRLLNYISSPDVLIWSAVATSCSVPLVFSPAQIMAKHPVTGETVPWNTTQTFIDGSVEGDLPMVRLAEQFNVNHFIVSQVNPHVVPFLVKEEAMSVAEMQDPEHAIRSSSSWLHTMTGIAKSEGLHRLRSLIEVGVLEGPLSKVVSILSQKYSGDITILPEISYADFPYMLSNPTVEFMEEAMLRGERATWPKFSRIKNHLAIELALDDAVQKLRAHFVFSEAEAEERYGWYVQSKPGVKKSSNLNRSGRQRNLSLASDPHAYLAVRNAIGNHGVDGHQKSRSLHVPSIYTVDTSSQGSVNDNPHNSYATSPPQPVDYTTSGAETSNIYTSDSYADLSSSSIESPNLSPVEWPHEERNLFHNHSTPSTPTVHDQNRRSSSYLTLTSVKDVASSSTSRPPPQAPSAGASKPNGPETRYRSMFHKGRARFKSPEPKTAPNPLEEMQRRASPNSNTGSGKFNALGLNIDLSGTRAMMLRKKNRPNGPS